MENNRSLSVDITKGTAIIAIVLEHIAFSYPSCRLVQLRCKGKRILTNILLCYLDLESFMSSMNCP